MLLVNLIVKKITAILFLLLFSFNWFGYRLMFDYFEKEAKAQLEFSLDNNAYDESQLIELKVPVHLPYQGNWTNFQRYDGEINLNGVVYKYVKRKLANDTLYLKCIPDTKKMNLQKAKNDFFSLSNNLAQNNHPEKPASSQNVLKYLQTIFYTSSFGINIYSPFSLRKNLWLWETNDHVQFAFLFTPEQPPDYPTA